MCLLPWWPVEDASNDRKWVVTAVEFEIRVAGTVPDELLGCIGDVEILVQPMSSTLTCAVADLAALHGLLHRLQSADLEFHRRHHPLPVIGRALYGPPWQEAHRGGLTREGWPLGNDQFAPTRHCDVLST